RPFTAGEGRPVLARRCQRRPGQALFRGFATSASKLAWGLLCYRQERNTRWGTGAWPERQAKKIPGSKSGEGNDCAAREACRLRFSGGRNRRLKSCGPARVTGGSGGTVPQL